MTDTFKLKVKMLESRITQRQIAQKLGISYNTVYRKVNGQSEFTGSEIQAIGKLLNLDENEHMSIFLREK